MPKIECSARVNFGEVDAPTEPSAVAPDARVDFGDYSKPAEDSRKIWWFLADSNSFIRFTQSLLNTEIDSGIRRYPRSVP
jgi:hypothetical protein